MKIWSMVADVLVIVFSAIGAWLVSNHDDVSKYGYIFFLVASLLSVLITLRHKVWSIAITNGIFVAINVRGLYNWFM